MCRLAGSTGQGWTMCPLRTVETSEFNKVLCRREVFKANAYQFRVQEVCSNEVLGLLDSPCCAASPLVCSLSPFKLHVQARCPVGEVSETQPLSFTVGFGELVELNSRHTTPERCVRAHQHANAPVCGGLRAVGFWLLLHAQDHAGQQVQAAGKLVC